MQHILIVFLQILNLLIFHFQIIYLTIYGFYINLIGHTFSHENISFVHELSKEVPVSCFDCQDKNDYVY